MLKPFEMFVKMYGLPSHNEIDPTIFIAMTYPLIFGIMFGAMMGVVMMLSGAEEGHINWAVIVFGNLFVCLMEGLIVGIQVLRLEYYEIFSRFYQGGGTEFRPYRHKTK